MDEESGELIRQEHLFHLNAIKTQCQLDNVVEGEGLEREEGLDESGSEGKLQDLGNGKTRWLLVSEIMSRVSTLPLYHTSVPRMKPFHVATLNSKKRAT